MRKRVLASVVLALAVAGPQAARGQPLCFQDLDATVPGSRSEVRLGVPDWSQRGQRRRRARSPRAGSSAVDKTAGALSLGASNPVVHGGYVGCGERVDVSSATGLGRLSYARSQDWDPWRRLDGDPFATEHFFDAAVAAPTGGAVEAGYALNMYSRAELISPDGNGEPNHRVGGSAFWMSGLDDRVRLQSSLGMVGQTIGGEALLAQHHSLEVEPLRFGTGGAVFANLSYMEADPDFTGGAGADVRADTRLWSVGAGVRSDTVGMRLDYRRGHDNLDDDAWQATQAYDEWIGRVDLDAPIGGLLVPDLISFRGSMRRDRETYDDELGTDGHDDATAGWGVNMLWRDDGTSAGVDVSGRLADSSALASAGVLPSQRLGLSLAGDAGSVRLSGRVYSQRQRLAADVDEDVAMDYGGTLAAALYGQRLEGSVAYGRTTTHRIAPAVRWGLAAELDAIDLLGIETQGGWSEDLFALGRLESQFAEDISGWQAEYTAKFVAGFRF